MLISAMLDVRPEIIKELIWKLRCMKKNSCNFKSLIIQNTGRPDLRVKGRLGKVVYFCKLTKGVRY